MSTTSTAALAAGALLVGGIAGAALTPAPAPTAVDAASAVAVLDAFVAAHPDPAPTPTASPSPSDIPTTVGPTSTPTSVVTSSAPSPNITTPTSTPSGSVGGTVIPFSPPTLTNPTTIDATKTINTGFVLDPARDYVIKLPTTTYKNTAGLSIAGGRNVVILGGTIDVGAGNNGVRRAAYFKNITGTLHIEGVRIGSSVQNLTEGINISAPNAVIQIANVKISTRTDGSQATNHADLLQTWNGPKTLRVFGFSGQSNYQAMFLNARDTNAGANPIEGTWSMDRISVEVTVPGGYTLWLVAPPSSIAIGRDVYAWGGKGLWKNSWTWPGVKTTAAPTDFAASAGLGYVSPGYA